MHILYLINATDSGPGVLLDEAARSGAAATLIHAPEMRDMSRDKGNGETRDVPETAAGFDALVVMGGVMGVYEDKEYPFIEKTRALVRDFHNRKRPVMGVCLGAQMIASAFGAPVYPMRGRLAVHEEWGFLPQTWTPNAKDDPLLCNTVQDLKLMQWHGDTFDMPEGAVHLATRETCPNQAFRMGDLTYGFQFHLEMTRKGLDGWNVFRAKAEKKPLAEIEALIEPQITASLDAQEDFARRTMRRWMALAI
ncbi:MAG: type 1 glutamine amidotransferase [Parvibaculum sp.]|nr:type 1 glutamine amidotransferase [Parvibaculum sp.]